MRIARHPAILLFLALSLAPVVLFGIKGPWYGGGSGPFLHEAAPFPQRVTPETLRRVSAWFNDRLGMRYPLVVIDSHWRLLVWRLRFRGDVLFGHGSWLFFNDSPPISAARLTDVRGALRMSEAEIATIDRQMTSARERFNVCGKGAFVLVAPNKQSIYPDELRRGGTYLTSRLDDVLARLHPDTRSMFIEPRPELRAAKSRHGVPVYHPTDSHWNDLGAFIAYQKIVDVLAKANFIDRPELATLEGVEIHAEATTGGDVATRLLYLPWNFPDQHIALRGGANAPLSLHTERDRVIVSNPGGRRKLLILADSFGPPLASLLARHFQEVEMLSRPTWPAVFDGEAIAARNPDVVLIEIAERSLPELLQPPTRLQAPCP
jgi:alginate O-acetyltransferase complex protein AlgJ